jgi:hypothetical protein
MASNRDPYFSVHEWLRGLNPIFLPVIGSQMRTGSEFPLLIGFWAHLLLLVPMAPPGPAFVPVRSLHVKLAYANFRLVHINMLYIYQTLRIYLHKKKYVFMIP